MFSPRGLPSSSHPRVAETETAPHPKSRAWTPSKGSFQASYLCFHLPAGDGCLPIIARPELQGHRARADVGDAQVGGRAGELCEGARRGIKAIGLGAGCRDQVLHSALLSLR